MNDGLALRAAILAHPEEDTPRLAYADWLKENGEPHGRERGEFIRFQLAYDHHDAMDDTGDRFGELEDAAGVFPYASWSDSAANLILSDLPATGGREGREFRWRRGFIDSVTLPAAVFIDRAKVLFAAHPVTVVRLSDVVSRHGSGQFFLLCGPLNEACRDAHRKLFDTVRVLPKTYYPDQATAHATLSRLCVAYGRSLVGLAPIPPNSPQA